MVKKILHTAVIWKSLLKILGMPLIHLMADNVLKVGQWCKLYGQGWQYIPEDGYIKEVQDFNNN